jgi:hypothetical protein
VSLVRNSAEMPTGKRWQTDSLWLWLLTEYSFKCHVQSETHVRQLMVVGEDPKKYINNYSTDFQRDFVSLLKTAHGEKWISGIFTQCLGGYF